MQLSQHIRTLKDKPVTVIQQGRKPLEQPRNFRVCPLGIQLYSARKMPEFELIDFKIEVPGGNGKAKTISCSGVVVRCAAERKSLYRVWVKFLDLPESARKRIRCVAKTGRLLCPYCENF